MWAVVASLRGSFAVAQNSLTFTILFCLLAYMPTSPHPFGVLLQGGGATGFFLGGQSYVAEFVLELTV